jgi:L-cysteate sulfo-lyase
MSDYILFKIYPQLMKLIRREAIGNWPTTLHPLEKLSAFLGGPDILIKRDDLSNKVYGGNKTRKLELILAKARDLGCREIITAGGLGSNHILATAALGGQAGFQVKGLFFCQPVTDRVKKNLLLNHYYGTEMHFVKDYFGLVRGYLQHYLNGKLSGRKPLLLMPGGSDSLTTFGYINCLLELFEQADDLDLPEPGAIFVAAGTGGTAAGLLAGLTLLTNCSSTLLHAVRVVQPAILQKERICNLAAGALSQLAKVDNKIRSKAARELEQKLCLEDNYLDGGYGFYSAKTKEAVKLFQELEDIELEECYTAKAAAALIDYCRRPVTDKNRPVVFINTAANAKCYNSLELPDPQELPNELQWCFNNKPRSCRCGLQKQNRSFCNTIRQPEWHWPG